MFGGSVDEDVTAGIVPLKTEAVMDRDGIIWSDEGQDKVYRVIGILPWSETLCDCKAYN